MSTSGPDAHIPIEIDADAAQGRAGQGGAGRDDVYEALSSHSRRHPKGGPGM
ncbi:hypothetical protein [Streptomyces sp. 11x1]|uniref:hypothetical protein n=1 Tax=Streptomyces sp. 11x1 TaxID=3038642 RepID=UPI0029302241|nr:hypothetical protein [Streptomyces sp. 11x1]WNZ10409.1 hypothetical protein P8T65_24455 [Streptomyces sp. 11x1]